MEATPNDVIKIIEVTINFMEISLLGENLSPSVEMERQENVDRLTSLIEKLNKIKDKGFELNSTQQKPINKFRKSEKKTEKPPEKESVNIPIAGAVKEESSNDDKKKNVGKDETTKDSTPLADTEETFNQGEYIMPGACLPSEDPSTIDALKLESLQKKVKILSKNSLKELKEKATYFGYLTKHKKRLLTKWHKRYCVLVDEFLFYFRSEDEDKEQGVIILPGYTYVVPSKSKGFLFTLESKDKSREGYVFQTDHQNDFDKWNYYLQKVTTKILSVEEMGIVNQLADEHILNIEHYDDVDASQLTNTNDDESFYDDVAVQSSSPTKLCSITLEEDELYDDVATPPALQTKGTGVVNTDVEEELYEVAGSTKEDELRNNIASQDNVAPTQLPRLPQRQISIATARPPGRLPETNDPPVFPTSHLVSPRPSVALLPVDPKDTQLRNSSSPSASPIASPGHESFTIENIYVGLYSCHGDDTNDLSFSRGDIIYKLEEIDMNWWLAYLNGKIGLVPSNFLVEAFN